MKRAFSLALAAAMIWCAAAAAFAAMPETSYDTAISTMTVDGVPVIGADAGKTFIGSLTNPDGTPIADREIDPDESKSLKFRVVAVANEMDSSSGKPLTYRVWNFEPSITVKGPAESIGERIGKETFRWYTESGKTYLSFDVEFTLKAINENSAGDKELVVTYGVKTLDAPIRSDLKGATAVDKSLVVSGTGIDAGNESGSSSESSSSSEESGTSGNEATGTVDAAEAADRVEKAMESAGQGTTVVIVRVRNAHAILAAALRAIARAADRAEKAPIVHADVVKGGKVESRLYIDPSLVQGNGEIKLGVTLEDERVSDKFDRFFSNDIAVVKFEQTGSFGMSIQAAVKLDLSRLETETLVFYSYNPRTNTYRAMVAPNYRIDANGYLHFTTWTGDCVIVTDRPLARR